MTHIQRSRNHLYTFDGITYPGVTSIVGVLDKPALMAWASRMTAEAAVRMSGDIARLVAEVGPEGVVKALTSRSAWERDQAASLGSEVHKIADLIATGQEVPAMTPEAAVRVDHYVKWWQGCGWRPRATEAMVINRELGYGGTFDILAYDAEGKTVLADYKTGKGVYPESVVPQLTLYAMAEFLEADGRLYGMPWPDRFSVIHVTESGVTEVPLDITERDREAAVALVTVARWKAGMGR